MKKILMLLFLIGAYTASANDVLTLTNNKVFEGEVTHIEKCALHFKVGDETFIVPGEEIGYVQFENPKNRILKRYMKMADDDACLKGTVDAQAFHGKQGMHIILGVLFGPFTVLGAALGSPTPSSGKETLMMSKNKDLFSDPTYLQCYKKKAKGQNVGNSFIGWGILVVLVLIF